MNRTTLLTVLLVLTFLGIADAWYLASAALSGTSLSCSIAGLESLNGCNQVAQSAYSQFLGLPLALYGVFFYAVLFVIAAILITMPIRLLYKVAIGLGVVGFFLSLYFVFLQAFVIKAVCVYCMASVVIATGIFFTTWTLWKRFAPVVVSQADMPAVAA